MLSVRRMLGREPRSATDQYNLGLEQLNSGAVSNAENSFRSALALKGDFPEAWVALAEALEAQGRDAEALTALDEAILHRHDYVGALTNASLLLRKMGRATDSQARAKAIDLVTQCAAGRSLELETLATQIVQELPKFGLAWKVMGAIAAKNRRFESALPALRQAASLLPSDPEAHHNFAIVLHTLAHMQEAEVAYRRAIALRSDYREAFSNLSNLLMTTGRLSDAEAACRQALDLDPLCFEAHSDMGNILGALGRPSEALISYRSALALKPDYHMAHANLGASLVALARLDEAEASCRRAVELKPDFPEGHHNLLFLLNYHPDKSPSEVFSAYRAFDARIGLPLHSAWRPHNNSREPARRLRVGYVSPDFRRHPARHFVEPLLEHHDKSKVEVFAYAQMAVEDEVTARMKTRVDHWVPTCGMTDVEMADRIRGDGIDVLVDLAGHTQGNRLLVFARKPAPVSVTTIGFGYTTGLSAIDWFMTDAIAAPDGTESVLSERPWRLPLCQVYRPAENMGPVGSLPALRHGYVTFGALTRAARINHRIVRLWSEILARVPGSRLLIDSLNFKDGGLCESMRGLFSGFGIGPDRVRMGYHSPPWDLMREIDISLDCFPQNSGTTLFESLYMGVPFITKADRPSLGRLGSSVAAHAGHAEWIAATEEEYIAKAVMLSADTTRLSRIRESLRVEVQRSALMNEGEYARQVEAAYRNMWQQWCDKAS